MKIPNTAIEPLMVIWEKLSLALNGRLTFGDSVNSTDSQQFTDNIEGFWKVVTTPAVAGTEFSISHNLGRVPNGYLVFSQNIAGSILKGAAAWTTETISLKASANSMTVTLFIT